MGQFQRGASQLGLQLLPSTTAIQPILIGESERASNISQNLLEQGFLISAIRPPTVPQGSARLRVTFSAEHTFEHVERLLNALDEFQTKT